VIADVGERLDTGFAQLLDDELRLDHLAISDLCSLRSRQRTQTWHQGGVEQSRQSWASLELGA
jgi:hypothetical protein